MGALADDGQHVEDVLLGREHLPDRHAVLDGEQPHRVLVVVREQLEDGNDV